MEKVLIAEDDMIFQEFLRESLEEYKDRFQTIFVKNGREAIASLRDNNISLLVTDIKMPEVDGFALLAHMSRHHPQTPCIVMTGLSIPRIKERLLKNGFLFLKKPFKPKSLARAIFQALEKDALTGSLMGFSVAGFLQLMEMEEKTCLLDIRLPENNKRGRLYCYEGTIHNAVCGNLRGEEAALEIIGMDRAQIAFGKLPEKKIPKKIETGLTSLILEAMRRKDERAGGTGERQSSQSRQDSLLAEGIRLCERMRFKPAQTLFKKLLRINQADARAWLWFSRSLGSLRNIRIVVNKAYKINPDDPDVLLEVKKIRSAIATVNNDRVSRCPFCWAPNVAKSIQCHFCNGYHVINPVTLPLIGKAVSGELNKAIDRYERILSEGLNTEFLYYSGLAYLNLNRLDKALDCFDQIPLIASNGKHYKEQVRLLLDFVASKGTDLETDVAEPKKRKKEAYSTGRKKRVLVVEDSRTTRKVISMTLQNHGFHVAEAGDGVEALSMLSEERPDLILLDVILPKIDGYGILSFIKQKVEFREIPVILLTGKDGLMDRIKGKFSGSSAYLTKPFKPEDLIKNVMKHMK